MKATQHPTTHPAGHEKKALPRYKEKPQHQFELLSYEVVRQNILRLIDKVKQEHVGNNLLTQIINKARTIGIERQQQLDFLEGIIKEVDRKDEEIRNLIAVTNPGKRDEEIKKETDNEKARILIGAAYYVRKLIFDETSKPLTSTTYKEIPQAIGRTAQNPIDNTSKVLIFNSLRSFIHLHKDSYQLSPYSDNSTIEKDKLYLKISKSGLEYAVIDPMGKEIKSSIVKNDLSKKFRDLIEKSKSNLLDIKTLQPFYGEILETLVSRKHAENKGIFNQQTDRKNPFTNFKTLDNSIRSYTDGKLAQREKEIRGFPRSNLKESKAAGWFFLAHPIMQFVKTQLHNLFHTTSEKEIKKSTEVLNIINQKNNHKSPPPIDKNDFSNLSLGYDICLLTDEILNRLSKLDDIESLKNKLYFKKEGRVLKYCVISPKGNVEFGFITEHDLKDHYKKNKKLYPNMLHSMIEFQEPLIPCVRKHLSAILTITSSKKRKHTNLARQQKPYAAKDAATKLVQGLLLKENGGKSERVQSEKYILPTQYEVAYLSTDMTIEKNHLYLKKTHKNDLKYAVITPTGKLVVGTITNEQLPPACQALLKAHKLDFNQLKHYAPDILDITERRGHTKPVYTQAKPRYVYPEKKTTQDPWFERDYITATNYMSLPVEVSKKATSHKKYPDEDGQVDVENYTLQFSIDVTKKKSILKADSNRQQTVDEEELVLKIPLNWKQLRENDRVILKIPQTKHDAIARERYNLFPAHKLLHRDIKGVDPSTILHKPSSKPK